MSEAAPQGKPRSALFGRLMLGTILVFFGLSAAELVRRWRAEPFELSLSWALLSMLPLFVGYAGVAFAFQRILTTQAPGQAPFPAVFELYCRGLIARYLPAKVGIPAVRMAAAKEFGVTPAFMAASAVLEALSSLATAGLLVAGVALGPWPIVGLSALSTQPWAPWAIAAIVLGVAMLAAIDVRFYPRQLMTFLRLEQRKGPLLPLWWIAGEAWLWIANAASCVLVVRALTGSSEAMLLGGASGIIAPALGFFVVIAPGGLGVREAIAVALMAPEIGATKALAFGLVSRAVLLVSELVLWLGARAWLGVARRAQVEEGTRQE
ncbi:MAG: lysylphosphatidylglycerol synthase domain-containing protein [Myxococcales bacterium]